MKKTLLLFLLVGSVLSAAPSLKITLSMVVKDEADRYLRCVLEDAKHYIDEAVIIDDGSSDETEALCREVLQGIPLRLVKNSVSKFANEVVLRKQQWFETIKTNPEWILILDADEIFESKFKDEIRDYLASTSEDAICFRLYDFWDEEHYRDDEYWSAHYRHIPFLIRYKPEVEYHWRETAQHCGRVPYSIVHFSSKKSPLRLKHYGWAKPKDRLAKYWRYQRLDPGCVFGWREQYESILDENPNLVAWEE